MGLRPLEDVYAISRALKSFRSMSPGNRKQQRTNLDGHLMLDAHHVGFDVFRGASDDDSLASKPHWRSQRYNSPPGGRFNINIRPFHAIGTFLRGPPDLAPFPAPAMLIGLIPTTYTCVVHCKPCCSFPQPFARIHIFNNPNYSNVAHHLLTGKFCNTVTTTTMHRKLEMSRP
eukprot:1395388-Amorphochlora_amoeboformis.AAC.1